jgi:beta-N-acetylhexosaminidase
LPNVETGSVKAMGPSAAAIFGCEGTQLNADERAFFTDVRPFGFIVFARNCESPDQLRALCDEMRATVVNPEAPIFIDQEGGRVQRLRPPHWRNRPAARRFGELFERNPEEGREATYLCARLLAHELRDVGVNANCTPVLDVPVSGAHDIIGDRAYSTDPVTVIALGRIVVAGHLDGGVLPVIKHLPGHGRALADSHFALPHVATAYEELSTHDFVTFRGVNDAPAGMTAHVVYEAIDPDRPATTSSRVVQTVIRREIGFDGLLMSDDLSMGALQGPLAKRTKSALLAGCDLVLHCNGKLGEMKEIAAAVKPLAGEALRRAGAALAQYRTPADLDIARAESHLAALVGSD